MDRDKAIKRVVQETKIPEAKIKHALGLPLSICKATTVEEANRAFREADYGSEKSVAAYKKLERVTLMTILDNEITLKRLEEIYELVPDFSNIEGKVIRRMVEIAER